MHRSGPPRKLFRSGGGPRFPHPNAQWDFTVDCDTPPGGFHQSLNSGQPYLPPPPVEGPPGAFVHGHPGIRPQFNPYPPPHYQHYSRPPGFINAPQHWGQGHSYQAGRGGWRGRGRGRYNSGGFRGRGNRQSQSKWRNEDRNVQPASGVDAYYSRTMFEDPWQDLLPDREQSEATKIGTSLDCGQDTKISLDQVTVSSTLDNAGCESEKVINKSENLPDMEHSASGDSVNDSRDPNDTQLHPVVADPNGQSTNCQKSSAASQSNDTKDNGTEEGVKLDPSNNVPRNQTND